VPRPPALVLTGDARPSRVATTGAAQRRVSDQERASQWWTLWHSSPLTTRIAHALQASPTLVAAQAALRQTLERVDAPRGAFSPPRQASVRSRQSLSVVSWLVSRRRQQAALEVTIGARA
jgi:outer membrane protein TolC